MDCVVLKYHIHNQLFKFIVARKGSMEDVVSYGDKLLAETTGRCFEKTTVVWYGDCVIPLSQPSEIITSNDSVNIFLNEIKRATNDKTNDKNEIKSVAKQSLDDSKLNKKPKQPKSFSEDVKQPNEHDVKHLIKKIEQRNATIKEMVQSLNEKK
ncbi:hypothetical protein QTN25_000767 [Entamoeba marina]